MGSSSRGNDVASNRPELPAPSGVMTPTPQVQPQSPVTFPQFLPSSNAMASGLTPEMFAAIAAMDAPPPATPTPGATSAPEPDPGVARELLAGMIQAAKAGDFSRAPENRADGRLHWNEDLQAYANNPDWEPTNRAGRRASSPGWGGSLAGKIA